MCSDFTRRRITALLVLIAAIGCGAPPTRPTPVPNQNQQPPPTPNNPPRIISITTSASRVEVGNEITLTATVVDDETSADQLKYEWTATAGTFTGTGRIVKWTAPTGVLTPVKYTISLTVVDQYRSGQQTLENRVSAQSEQVLVEDSFAIVKGLSEKFLDNFANSNVTPEVCVQDFSDATTRCAKGRRSELSDIVFNRQTRVILDHTVTVFNVQVDPARIEAEVLANCRFTSRVKATGAMEYVTGVCELDLIYDKSRWWLCTSSFHGRSSLGLMFTL